MLKHSEWLEPEHDKLMELRQLHPEWSYQQLADQLTNIYGTLFTFNAVRNRIRRNKHKVEIKQATQGYKETVEILSDGSHKSDKLLQMDAEQCKDVDYLLHAHGYDKNAWELVSARNNIWNVYSTEHGVQTLFASKIAVKPLQNQFSIDKLIEAIQQAEPIIVEIYPIELKEKRLLEIPLFDSHFGVSDYEYYKSTQSKVMNLLSSRKWEEILFVVGQDALHNNDFRGKTANGTPIEQVDMVKAWHDCRIFYEPLLEKALRWSNSVKVMYSKGNHDESLSWAFVQYLKGKYPQITFDDEMKERKAHVFGATFIGITHGDKARKNLHNIFPVEFPVEWSNAKNRELHTGHFHVEDAKDVYGMMVRTLATRNKTDHWHRDNGFVGAHKRFMLFEYSEEELEAIYYV